MFQIFVFGSPFFSSSFSLCPFKTKFQVDAAVCGEMASLVDLIEQSWSTGNENKEASRALIAASSAGRTQLIRFMIEIFMSQLEREETIKRDQNNWLSDLINDSLVVPMSANGAHIEVLKILLSIEGVNINIANSRGQTALWLACEKGHNEVVKLLLGLDEEANSFVLQPTCNSKVEEGNLNTSLITNSQSNVDPNQFDQNGKSPLWIARDLGRTNIVDLLLRHPNIDRCTCCSFVIKKPSNGFKILVLLGLACFVVFIYFNMTEPCLVSALNCTFGQVRGSRGNIMYVWLAFWLISMLYVMCWYFTDILQKCSNGMAFYYVDQENGIQWDKCRLLCVLFPPSAIFLIIFTAYALRSNEGILFTCHDIVPWVDKDGDSCTPYEANDNFGCQTQGTTNGTDGITANRACCACGGGINIFQDISCQNIVPWEDEDSRRCTAYGTYSRCTNTGTDGITANSACCACGGGIR